MQTILNFLTDLSANNQREWFEANKTRYIACKERFEDFTTAYLHRLTEIDEKLQTLTPKDCIWRIYRDVRFSKDKRPYKEWFGAFPAEGGGRKSQHGGYYVHIQPGHCLFAAGIWCPSPDLLKTLRKEIEANYEEVEQIMASATWKKYFTDFDTEDMLKKVPTGFDPNFIHADWLKRKSYTFSTALSEQQVCQPDFLDLIMDISRAAKPMLDFLNYTFEEFGDFSPRPCR